MWSLRRTLTPRTTRIAIAAVMLVLVPLFLRPAAPDMPTGPATDSVDGVVIPVADLQRAVDFYTRVLMFEHDRVAVIDEPHASVARLRLGREVVELVEYRPTVGRPVPPESRSNDLWFQHVAIVVNDMEQAYLWLERHHVARVSPAPQRLPDWNPNVAGLQAFYFKDPDGHTLEILEFPPDKGTARWHARTDRVFLGIDHTAIAVTDTERSVRFYGDLLGLRVVGRSENYGVEQEMLNAVKDARLRITTLRAGSGPGVGLLEYLSPRDGRPLPADARLTDLVAWRTVMTVALTKALVPVIEGAGGTVLSAGQADVILRDPDGHALQLRSR